MNKSILISLVSNLLFFILLNVNFVLGENIISFEKYKQNITILSNKNQNRDINTIELEFMKNINKKCIHTKINDGYIISPICLWEENYPKLGFTNSINIIWPHIKGFEKSYDLYNQEFEYENTKPIIEENDLNLAKQFNKTIEQKQIINSLYRNSIDIEISNIILANEAIKEFSFYSAPKILTDISNCSLRNYFLALSTIDGLYLQPKEKFNLNKAIANLKGYCKGSGRQDLMFFGGVCGTSGQLFRNAIINPSIITTKRYPHNNRRTRYYGQYIFGDDAAIYQMDKQFEIQNNDSFPIYFKVLDKGDINYLISILPYKSTQKVSISKQQIGNLKAELIKNTLNKTTNEISNTEIFMSQYISTRNSGV